MQDLDRGQWRLKILAIPQSPQWSRSHPIGLWPCLSCLELPPVGEMGAI
uniref:Uncharacterized protein n=1 Tax=Anguilla anguilla TaxID=7936 RepID=A0A0E9STP9_ANGAN